MHGLDNIMVCDITPFGQVKNAAAGVIPLHRSQWPEWNVRVSTSMEKIISDRYQHVKAFLGNIRSYHRVMLPT